MRLSALIPVALASLALALPQASSGVLKPAENPPAGCSTSYTGNFGLTVVELGKRSLDKRSSCTGSGSLDLTLKDSVLTDSKGRTGSIVANFQFQFDGPAQAGAIYTSGFSVCANGSLALGGSTTFYRCLSGDFYNLYDRHWAEQCSPIILSALPCGAEAPAPSGGQIVGTTMVVTTVVTVIGDGQPQVVPTTIPVPLCQIGDGQVQGHTTPCGELPPVTVTPSVPAASQPPYTPPGTPVAPPGTPVAPPASTAPSVPPVSTSPVPVPVPSSPVNSTAVITTPGTTPTTPATTTTPAAPSVAAGQNLAPASFVALVATLMAVVCLI
ncbi:covalently-linked cell wall protein [Colletotrichum orchidophilum]|uniref:Covalently-linked cell wall protein n=1 Tax=Colletotrichum orchidophilum TaxID=1209926 RepID=A0A1G4B7W7_9PEZI|nr:covalently-linked cell wall protein [Colletotrichum orchidophilum]OHE97507.1 covalently-linked cell wall protein [Colletotrichum orchidophilum]